jgi:hypothetical protein
MAKLHTAPHLVPGPALNGPRQLFNTQKHHEEGMLSLISASVLAENENKWPLVFILPTPSEHIVPGAPKFLWVDKVQAIGLWCLPERHGPNPEPIIFHQFKLFNMIFLQSKYNLLFGLTLWPEFGKIIRLSSSIDISNTERSGHSNTDSFLGHHVKMNFLAIEPH